MTNKVEGMKNTILIREGSEEDVLRSRGDIKKSLRKNIVPPLHTEPQSHTLALKSLRWWQTHVLHLNPHYRPLVVFPSSLNISWF